MTALKTLAVYAYEYGSDARGHLRTALLAAVLTERFGIHAAKAIAMAREDNFDPRVRDASDEVDRLLRDAARAAMAAEYGQAVPA